MTPFHPAHLYSPLRLEDITQLCDFLPLSAQELVQSIGAEEALALISRWGGVQIINIPKTPSNNPHGARRWALLAEVIGEHGMEKLAKSHGGKHLNVPLCHDLRLVRRNRAIVAEFDVLTKGGQIKKNKAVELLVLKFAPITYRQVEKVLDAPDDLAPEQPYLFDDHHE